jgi:hypothetical protein
VDHLVVAALQEGRVDRAEGAQAPGGEAGAEGHGVLLGDAHVEAAWREASMNLKGPVPSAWRR